MPLYKKKPFPLAEVPKDLKPQELVFQVRFTKEIFTDYSEYLKRINLYRARVWTCKATGKSNLTYEEALVSEKEAAEKIQTIPKELIGPILQDVQFSMLPLRDLANEIAAKLQGPFAEGAEWYARREGRLHRCKILKVIQEADEIQYQIGWLDNNQKITSNALVTGKDMMAKKLPFTRAVLRSFIKDSTYRNLPWVLHDKLAKKYEISTTPPDDLKSRISVSNGIVVCSAKRKRNSAEADESKSAEMRKNLGKGKSTDVENGKAEAHSKYPIDDLLLDPADDDGSLTERPSPCRDFNAPMDCVGDLLMVWDFCNSFGRLLKLSPFSLEDFENAICHKDSTPVLIVEACSSLLRSLIGDNGEFSLVIEKKKRKPKITAITWSDYLCDFLETSCTSGLASHISTIKRGHYGLLDTCVKLAIFKELISQVLDTHALRQKLDEYIEERQALAATRRDEALEKGRKRREEKERLKSESDDKAAEVDHGATFVGDHVIPNGDISAKKDVTVLVSGKNQSSGKRKTSSESDQVDGSAKKNAKRQRSNEHALPEDIGDLTKREVHKLLKNDIKEVIQKKNTEERKEYIEREIEKRVIRTNPLGKDRIYNRYWFFRRDGRVFVESSDSKQWSYYHTKEEIDAFMGSLNPKGERERVLKKQLEKNYQKICVELHKRFKEAAQKVAAEEAVLRRSTRVRAPPRENPALAFLKYVNKWKET